MGGDKSRIIFSNLTLHSRAKLLVEYIGARIGSRRQFAAVYRSPVNVNRLEAEPVRRDLNGHKAAVLVMAGGEIGRVAFEVSAARPAAGAGDEILYALLRFGALVNMVVS